MERKVYHVLYDSSTEQWKAKAEDGARASVVSDTKADAEEQIINIAKNYGNSQVIIHGMDGRIQYERTYGNDPHPPLG